MNFIKKDKEHFDLVIGCCAKKSLLTKLNIEEEGESFSDKIDKEKNKNKKNNQFIKMLNKFIDNISFSSRVQSEEGCGGFVVKTFFSRYYIKNIDNGERYSFKGKNKKFLIQLAYLLAVNKKEGFDGQVLQADKVTLFLTDPCSYIWPNEIVSGSQQHSQRYSLHERISI